LETRDSIRRSGRAAKKDGDSSAETHPASANPRAGASKTRLVDFGHELGGAVWQVVKRKL
jgi:hypothetical protein